MIRTELKAGSEVFDRAGSLVFDTVATDSNPDSNIGQYIYATSNPAFPVFEPPLGITINIAGGPTIAPKYTLGGMSVGIRNDDLNPVLGPNDTLIVNQTSVIDGTPIAGNEALILGLFDTTRTAFVSDSLPTSLSLDLFDLGIIQLLRYTTTGDAPVLLGLAFDGVAYVPEPSSLALVGIGLVGLGAYVRRRAR